jgi:hypothetical protein
MPFAVQTENKRFHRILRAGLSGLVAECAMAAIFAGKDCTFIGTVLFQGKSDSLFPRLNGAIYAIF